MIIYFWCRMYFNIKMQFIQCLIILIRDILYGMTIINKPRLALGTSVFHADVLLLPLYAGHLHHLCISLSHGLWVRPFYKFSCSYIHSLKIIITPLNITQISNILTISTSKIISVILYYSEVTTITTTI